MSSLFGIDILVMSIGALMAVASDLKIAAQQKNQMRTQDGARHSVDMVIKDENNNREIGFQKQKDGSYKIIADAAGLTSAQVKKQQQLINKVKQKYAYKVVVQELKKQGYQVAEEKAAEKGAIKLVVRKWVH